MEGGTTYPILVLEPFLDPKPIGRGREHDR